jgi:hypothetical protein
MATWLRQACVNHGHDVGSTEREAAIPHLSIHRPEQFVILPDVAEAVHRERASRERAGTLPDTRHVE